MSDRYFHRAPLFVNSETDTGVGMNSEQLKKVFEPFYTTKRKGLGLGMAYVRRIVEQHEGKISVQSQPGEGVVIEIDVPAPVVAGAAEG